ncbi:MAG TPA: 2-hydroxy-3-oxopropionate reductase [Solirubrobacteraceae bacterium]|jgi:2-hydroxy-3-oxopropionate reductase|nr:2-hydroxy-3-oxopropionate reductase [Solirubrobacteraceae bacterium]
MSERVGFIGLGVMGRPMVRNLLAAGLEVTVYNRSKAAVEELVAEGAAAAESPSAVAASSDITVLMLADDRAVDAVVFGPDGVLAGVGGGALVIDMSTVSPALDRRIAAAAAERGADFLDAPVSGGDAGAKAGTLSIMVGGPADAFARAKPVFEILGTTIVHVGEHGSGQVVKACNQVVVALTLEALAEALVLASKCGVDPAVVTQVLAGGLANSRVLELRGPNMLEHRFDPGFAIALHHKDLGIALSEARASGVCLPGTAMVDQMFASVRQYGGSGLDHSGILTHLERLADHTIGEDNE